MIELLKPARPVTGESSAELSLLNKGMLFADLCDEGGDYAIMLLE